MRATLHEEIMLANTAYGEEDAPLDVMLRELNAAQWPVLMLERSLPELLTQASALFPADRCAWLAGLHGVWNRHGWALSRAGKCDLLELATLWCAWPLAREVGLALTDEGPLDSASGLRLTIAFRNLGEVEAALDLSVSMQLAYPRELCHDQLHRGLMAWRAWRDTIVQCPQEMMSDGDLYLEPLAHHHAADFAWQYYDPAIAELCCLPWFQDDAAWHKWLDDIDAFGDQRCLAVMHPAWGLIGCVSLILHDDIGFFYYWIGPDFQGGGFGPRAAALMLTDALYQSGMRCCYAKVYSYNIPSLSALKKIGFDDLGLCGAAPYNDQLFYRLGGPQSYERTAAELHAFMDYLDSDVQMAMPLIRE